MKRSLFIILGTLCFAIAGKAQGSDVSVQKKNTGYRILNDTMEAVKDSMTFEQRVEMINRMKRKQDTKLLRFEAGITGGFCDANESSYMVELTFAYYPLTYVGVSCGIEWNDNHGDRPLIDRYEDDEYDPKRVIKINLTPGLAFRTPTLWLSKRRTAGLMLHCEPGLCITPFYNDRVSFTEIKDAQGVGHPASYTDELYGNATIRTVSNHGGKWLAWRIKSAGSNWPSMLYLVCICKSSHVSIYALPFFKHRPYYTTLPLTLPVGTKFMIRFSNFIILKYLLLIF